MCVSESVHCSESQLANFTYVTLVSEDGEDDGEDDDEDDGEDDDEDDGEDDEDKECEEDDNVMW